MRDLLDDLRYALRIFAQNPGFTLVSVLALALGIGATTSIFSVVDTILLRPLPYPEPNRLVSIGTGGANGLPSPDYFDWRTRNHVFEEMTAYRSGMERTLTGVDEPVQLPCAEVTESFFRTLGVQPLLGRAFTAAEDKPGAAKVILLTYGTWQRRFGGDRGILGRSLTLDGAPYTIIGVLPPSFRFPGRSAEALVPLAFNTNQQAVYYFAVVARLRSGISFDQATAETGGFFEQSTHGLSFARKMKLSVVRLQERQVANVRLAMLALLGAVACVLLISCANVANLLLSRSAARQREIAVRAALGAGRRRLIRQLLTESVLLGLAGGGAGLLLAALTLKSLIHLAPPVPRLEDVAIDWRILGSTLLTSLAVSLIFGLAPALRASQVNLNDALKQSAPSASAKNRGLRSLLVVAELSLSLVLLVGAGLLIQTLWRLEHIHTGIAAEHVLATQIPLSRKQYSKPAQRRAFFDGLLEHASTLPGVVAAGATDGAPPYTDVTANLTVEGAAPHDKNDASYHASFKNVTRDYFATLGIPLHAGRFFDARDARLPDVAIVNEALVRRFFPNEDPIGKRVSSLPFDKARTIVGIVGDVKNQGLVEPPRPELYRLDEEGDVFTLFIRTAGDPLKLTGEVRDQVRALDRYIPLTFHTMTEQLDREFSSQRFNSIILSAFAAMALFLAAIGIYGVMSYLVTNRTQEIGIRMALGARTGHVLGLVIGQALRLVIAGVAVGIALALALTRYLASLLYGVTTSDAATFCSVAFLLIAVALFASYIPARRATRVDPLSALRSE